MYRVWTPVWIAVAAAVGAVAGYALRSTVFHLSVAAGTPWRLNCPACDTPIVQPGWRLVTSGLRVTGAEFGPEPRNTDARSGVDLAGGPRLDGHCPSCGARIGPPVGVAELVTAAVTGLLAWRLGLHPATFALAWAGIVGVALAFVDVAVHRLPDRLIATALFGTLVGFGLATALGTPYHRILIAMACGLGAAAGYFLIVFLSPSGMGLGDAKLALLVGLTAGWFGVGAALYGIFIGFLLAGLTALTLLTLRRVSRRDRIAHGPFMLLGALIAILLVHT